MTDGKQTSTKSVEGIIKKILIYVQVKESFDLNLANKKKS